MKKLLILIALITTSRALSADWFCTEESSEVMSSEVRACGVAVSQTEGEARSIALDNAFTEFSTICKHSESCGGRKYDMIPARTDCKQLPNGFFKCYRMVRFTLFPREIK